MHQRRLLVVFVALAIPIAYGISSVDPAPRCEDGWASFEGSCYKILTESNIYNAQVPCENVNSKLASVKSQAENEFIINLASNAGQSNTNYIIDFKGLTNSTTPKAIWGDLTTGDFTNEMDATVNWSPSDCYKVLKDFNDGHPVIRWSTVSCTDQGRPVCKRTPEEPSPCDEGWTYFKDSNSCYMVLPQMPMKDAHPSCLALNSNLTSIHSKEENIFLVELGNQYFRLNGTSTYPRFSIGMKRGNRTKAYWDVSWIDGTEMNYEPAENFNGYDNDDRIYFVNDFNDDVNPICKRVLPDEVPTTIAPTTEAPTTEAATTEAATTEPATTEPATTVPVTVAPVPACLEGWEYFEKSDACYKVLSRIEAQLSEKACNDLGGNLTSIHSKEENMFVVDLGNEFPGTNYRYAIGLRRISNTTKWNVEWMDGTTANFFPAPPDWGFCDDKRPYFMAYGNGENNQHEYYKYKWNDMPSDYQVHPICKMAANTKFACEEGWELFGTSCYKVHHRGVASEAGSVCEADSSKLASIYSEEENNFIVDYANKHQGTNYHYLIGLKKLADRHTTEWIDGTTGYFTNGIEHFKEKFSGESKCYKICGEGDKVFPWTDFNCSHEGMPICKKAAIRVDSTLPTYSCEDGWTFFKGSKSCVTILDTVMTSQSQAACEGLGGKLPIIHTVGLYNFLLGLAIEKDEKNPAGEMKQYVLGLQTRMVNGEWVTKWYDGTLYNEEIGLIPNNISDGTFYAIYREHEGLSPVHWQVEAEPFCEKPAVIN